MLMTSITGTDAQLRLLASLNALECTNSTNRADLINMLVRSEFGHAGGDLDSAVSRAMEVDIEQTDGGDCDLADPITELVFDQIDGAGEDFPDFKKSINARRTRQRMQYLRRGRGTGKGKGRGKQKGEVLVVEPPPPEQPPPQEGHPDIEQPLPEVPAAHGDGAGESFNWGTFRITHRPGLAPRPGRYYARCSYHEKELSATATGFLYCTKEITIGKGAGKGLDEAQVLRRLKQWCVEGDPDTDRKDHMRLHRSPIESGEIFDDAMLDSVRVDRFDFRPIVA